MNHMKTLILLIPIAAYSQCPQATPVSVTACSNTASGYRHVSVNITPAITNLPGNYSYTWTASPQATVSGQNSGILQTATPGVYTLTIKNNTNSACPLDVTTHTVEACPAGTNMVGLEENRSDELPAAYYDLNGQITEFKPGVILIERRGTRYRKCWYEPRQ
jgi:hypothetical protein